MNKPAFPSSVKLDPSLKHLQAELARIDLLIQRQVRCWRLAGQDPADTFRGLYVSDAEVDGLLTRSLGGNWGQTITLPAEQSRAFAEAQTEATRQCEILVETARSQNQSLRLVQLATTFGLSQFELDTLLICLAPTLDLRYERLYSYLQDDVTRKRPTVNLALDLLAEPNPLGEPGLDRLHYLTHFSDNGPLFKYRLLEYGPDSDPSNSPLLNQTLRIDEAVVSWLLGRYQPHAILDPYATLLQTSAQPHKIDTLLAGEIQIDLPRLDQPNQHPVIAFFGPDQTSQNAAARLLAAQMSRPLLIINLAAVIKTDIPAISALRLALRDARLVGALPYLFGWDACLNKEGQLSPNLLTELCDYPDLVIVAGQTQWQAEGINRERPLYWVGFPVPNYAQRVALWEYFLKLDEAAGKQPDLDIPALAGQFALTTGQIRDTINSAKDMAAQRGQSLQNLDLFTAARAHSNPRLSALARKIVPRYEWLDIVLPADQLAILHEIVDTVRGRPLVLEQWGVGQKLASSAAITVLFAGDPGTGKTMAAEVIATELRLDLYKIDLSTVVSKYIGETEKNLEKIFNEAESSNAILFFDEADAIFGKRSEVKDAHDRYANIEISYLLQRMEAYDGVTILATNLRANLDEAFTRRLQFAVDFPFPEKEDRLRIWHTLFPAEVPRDAELNFELLAKRFKLAGGNIRNIIVSAAYLAAADGGQVTMHHLLHGTRRELQKMGRLVNETDLKID